MSTEQQIRRALEDIEQQLMAMNYRHDAATTGRTILALSRLTEIVTLQQQQIAALQRRIEEISK